MHAHQEYLERVRHLNENKNGDRRAPHQPLLLLLAIGKLQSGQAELPFKSVEEELRPILAAYAPPVRGRHEPRLPYWHLLNKGVWELDKEPNALPRQKGGFPVVAALRETSGHLAPDFAGALQSDSSLMRRVVRTLLEEHFYESTHEQVLAATGIALPEAEDIGEVEDTYGHKRARDPRFRERVLHAYEYRCAVTGFRAALAGQYLGCEAAHVKMHSYNGPDTVQNGFAVEPTLHTLFDIGAWTLTDDRRVLVSSHLSGDDGTVERLRDLHGRKLARPIPGEPEIAVPYIRWHREVSLGGVFRHPALPL